MQRFGHRHATLGEVTERELQGMLEESETLFIEHKGNLDPRRNFDFAKAVASFANTLGGWVLIGITNGGPNEGSDGGWRAPESHALVDRVRQALEFQVDPLPSFSAAIRLVHGKRVGVVRVYESVDTPHILRNGSIVVREPAQAKDLRARGRAEARPIATHYELTQLALRGERARSRAEARFAEGALPFVESATDLRYTTYAGNDRVYRGVYGESPAVVVRATPLAMTRPFEDWASSMAAEEACREAAMRVVGEGLLDEPEVAARGVSVSATASQGKPLTARGLWTVTVRATAVADAGGVIAVRAGFLVGRPESGPEDRFEFNRLRFAERFIEPPVVAAARMLQKAELFGRHVWHVHLLRLGELVSVERSSGGSGFPDVPLGGEITIPAFDASVAGTDEPSRELRAVLARWAHETSRGAGVRSWPHAP